MNANLLQATLVDQANRIIQNLRLTIQAFPTSEWRIGDNPAYRPAAALLHTIETVDFYAGSLPDERFPWAQRFNIDWETEATDQLPDQDSLLGYLDEMQAKLFSWLAETDLLAPEAVFPWTGPTGLGRAIYLLRHTQHHVAAMGAELHRRGCPEVDW